MSALTKQQWAAARRKCEHFERLTEHKAMPIKQDGRIVFQITLADWAARAERRVQRWQDMPRYSTEELEAVARLEKRLERDAA